VSRNPALFSNAEGIRPDVPFALGMMIDMDDPAHMKRRKLVNRGFTPRRIRDSEADIRKACDEIIDNVCERGECEFVMDVAAWLPMIMIGDALGVAPEDRGLLLEWSDELVKGLVGGEASATEGAAIAFANFQAFMTEQIAQRRAEPRDDLLSVLVTAEIDGEKLDDQAIFHESLLILIGGDETTRHVINGGMYQLLIDPEAKQAIADDPSKLPVAMEEMLRWVSPIRNMSRTVTADTELAGKELKQGDKVMLLYPSANRDASVFDDPDTFDIARTPNEHVAFGFGTHFCLGNSLARLELRCMFEQVLARMPDIELAEPGEPANRPANFVSGYERMPVRFTPSKPVLR
jgi:cytochrome P450 family 142 subfamily A polypeptide 1